MKLILSCFFLFCISGLLSAQEVLIKCEDYAVEVGERIAVSFHCPYILPADTVIWKWNIEHEILEEGHAYRFLHQNNDSLYSNYFFLKLKVLESGLIELPSPIFYFGKQKVKGESIQLYVISEREMHEVYQSDSFRKLLSWNTDRNIQVFFKGKYGYLQYVDDNGIKTIQLSKREIKKIKRILQLK